MKQLLFGLVVAVASLLCLLRLPVLSVEFMVNQDGHYVVGKELEKELLLVFMSYDCGGCLQSLPTLTQIYRQQDSARELGAVVYNAAGTKLINGARRHSIEYPLAYGQRALADHFAVKRTPTLLWFDQNWKIKGRYLGPDMLAGLATCLGAEGTMCRGLTEINHLKEGEVVATVGRLIRGEEQYFLADGESKIAITPWFTEEEVEKISPKMRSRHAFREGNATTPAQVKIGNVYTVSGSMGPNMVLSVENILTEE